jgi:hypothetical protein
MNTIYNQRKIYSKKDIFFLVFLIGPSIDVAVTVKVNIPMDKIDMILVIDNI